MNISQLKYFYTICTHNSISKAADILYISQPSLSNSIKKLEKEFGIKLFNRHHDGVQLTSDGMLLYDMFKDILERIDHLEETVKNLREKNNILNLGISSTISNIFLLHIYNEFTKMYPDISIKVAEEGYTTFSDKLRENYYDISIILHNQPIDNNYNSVLIEQPELICWTTESNPISKKKRLTPMDLKEQKIILFEDYFYITKQIQKWFSQKRIKPNIIMQTKHLVTMRSLLSADDTVGFTLKKIAENNSTSSMVAIPLNPPVHLNLSLIWKKNPGNPEIIKKFRDFICSVTQNKK